MCPTGFNKKIVLINLSNIRVGGAIQVAVSFLKDFSEIRNLLKFDFVIYVSNVVHRNLLSLGYDFTGENWYNIFNSYGIIGSLRNVLTRRFSGYDLVFTVFGPFYSILTTKCTINVVGFAQAWIIYPKNDVVQHFPFIKKISNLIKYRIQWIFFKKANILICELPHVKDGIVSKGYPKDNVRIVPNCLASVYYKGSLRHPRPLNYNKTIRLGLISRGYPHKNIAYIYDVAKLISNTNTKYIYEFHLTLTEDEKNNYENNCISGVFNHGEIDIGSCIDFYSKLDAVIFPTLLESFSATPYESFAMRLPLFASDRLFMREVCSLHAIYIDPLDPRDAVLKIINWFERTPPEIRTSFENKAFDYVITRPKSMDRTRNYINIIESLL